MTQLTRISRHLALAAVTAATLSFGLVHAQSAGTLQPTAAAPAPLLTIGDIYDHVVQAGYQDVRQIEFDDGRYEVDARDAQGQRVELHLNAKTGKIEHSHFDD